MWKLSNHIVKAMLLQKSRQIMPCRHSFDDFSGCIFLYFRCWPRTFRNVILSDFMRICLQSVNSVYRGSWACNPTMSLVSQTTLCAIICALKAKASAIDKNFFILYSLFLCIFVKRKTSYLPINLSCISGKITTF